MSVKEDVLKYLENDAHLNAKNIAHALKIDERAVQNVIDEAEKDGTLLAYKAIVNWDKTEREFVSAIIEIKVLPMREEGFDAVARQICMYPEVVSLYLMSGGFDLAVVVESKTLRDVAFFVSDKLAVIDGVTSTATHFVLNKYKDKNVIFKNTEEDNREYVL